MILGRKAVASIFFLLAMIMWSCLGAKPKQKGLIPGSAGPFRPGANEQILLYYDLNRDYKTDLLTKSLDRDSGQALLNCYIWNTARKEYYASGSFPIENYVLLKSILASSFKGQKFKLILFYASETASESASIVIRPFSCENYQCELFNPLNVPQISTGLDSVLPTLISIEGNIGLMHQSRGTINILTFTDQASYKIETLASLAQGQADPTDYVFSSVGDYNNDCWTDLILLRKSAVFPILEFFRGDQYNTYTFAETIIVEELVRFFTIQDINFDGKNDLIVLLASGDIQVHYNRDGNNQNLCDGTNKPFDYQASNDKLTLVQRISLGRAVTSDAVLLFGDYDNDGYDDFTVTQVDPSSGLPIAALFHNQPCLLNECGSYNPLLIEASTTLNLRTFVKRQISGLSKVIPRLSFIDIGEDGNLDFMAEVQLTDEKGRYLSIQPVYNNYGYDAFFLTITLLAPRNMTDYLSNTEYIGGCTSFYVTLLSGELAPRTGTQLSQTGFALQLPMARFGLGRTNNYLQVLTVSLPRQVSTEELVRFQWSPIVPNSDILVIPPPSDTVSSSIASQWVLQVMIEPTSKMVPVLLLVVAGLVVLGLIIIRLSRHQAAEDKQSQQSFYTLLR